MNVPTDHADLSLIERGFERLLAAGREWAFPFLSALAAGLLAHMFVMTKLLPNHDGLLYFIGKGGTVDSGRWGLELLRLVFPDLPLPWLYGALSLLLMAAAICLILQLFDIKSRLKQAILAALIISFPSQTAIFCYMFTSTCYAISFLLAVLAVRSARSGGKGNLAAVLLLLLSMGIYQAYLMLAASLLILLLVKDLLSPAGEDQAVRSLKTGLRYLLLLLLCLGLYAVSVPVSLRVTGATMNYYSDSQLHSIPSLSEGLKTAYRMFLFNLTSRYHMLVVSKFSSLLHLGCLLLAALGLICSQIKARCLKNTLVLALCLLLFPLSLCCIYMAVSLNSVHAIVLYGYVSLYILFFLAVEHLPRPVLHTSRDLTLVMLTLVVGINITFANRTFLKLDLQYENAYSLSTVLLAQIRSLPGYTADMKLAIYDYSDQYRGLGKEFSVPNQDWDLIGVNTGPLSTAAAEENFLRYILGAEMKTADNAELDAILQDNRTAEMPCYPSEGSIQIINDVVLVKFR